MLAYFRMKKNELKVKVTFYELMANIIDNQKEYIEFIKKIYDSLKDVPVNEFKSEFIEKLGEIAYEKSKDVEDTDIE